MRAAASLSAPRPPRSGSGAEPRLHTRADLGRRHRAAGEQGGHGDPARAPLGAQPPAPRQRRLARAG